MTSLNTTTLHPTDAEFYTVAVSVFSGDVPEFEVILPCIFGLLAVIALSMIVFYTKTDDNVYNNNSQPSSPKMKSRKLDEGFIRYPVLNGEAIAQAMEKMMKYLCCLQLAAGLAAMSAGLAGIVLWTQNFLAYLPAVGAGITFLMAGWYGIVASTDKQKSVSKATIALILTLLTLPVAICILGVSMTTFSVYVQDKAILPEVMKLNITLFKSQDLSTRGTSVWVAVLDLSVLTSGLLQALVAILTFRKLNKLIETREEDQIMRLFNCQSGTMTPPYRGSYTNAWAYNGPAYYDENIGMAASYPLPPAARLPRLQLQSRDYRADDNLGGATSKS